MFKKFLIFNGLSLLISVAIAYHYPLLFKYSTSLSVGTVEIELFDNIDKEMLERQETIVRPSQIPSRYFMSKLVDDFDRGIGNCSQYVSSFINKFDYFHGDTQVLHFLPYNRFSRGGGHSVIFKNGVIYDVYDGILHSKTLNQFLEGSSGFSTYTYYLSNREKFELGIVNAEDVILKPPFEMLHDLDGYLLFKYIYNFLSVYMFINTPMTVSELPYSLFESFLHYLAIANIIMFWLFNILIIIKRVIYVWHIRRNDTI